jgi:type I restriction-modification system DNA methylase subunit
MGLFQKSVVTKYLKTQNTEVLASKWLLYSAHFLNPKVQNEIKGLKEEQYQGEFLEDLFVKILGYTKPASATETKFNLTTEYKNVKDSKKADGAIIINRGLQPLVIGIIELKGTNTTDLGKIEEQAFGYKNNQSDCVYVITSNFEKLRFYIDNAIEHIEFNLFTLTQEEFHLLYLCLGFENIFQNIGKKIKEESISQEDVITKKLYKDYSLFKKELYQNLVELNPNIDSLLLFKKSQKLLDRFLFLFFGEDRHLLPPNSVRLILTQWNQLKELDEYAPLYVRFKKYFGYLNTGFKGKKFDVFAYNGGLFKTDEVLDTVKIDDDLLYKHTLKLSDYDFASEVDVNILGHIFENSLNELEEINAQLEGLEIDKTKSRRKKDGVFYTPKYITKYIVENTVGKLCDLKKLELQIIEEEYFTDKKRQKKTIQGLVEKLEIYRNWLLKITICDPACGSGAFLNQALDFLIAEHRYIDELQAKLFGDALVLSDIENSILENNLFGVDLNEESVEIAKLSLWLRTAQPNRKLNDLSNNIKCGNSLIDDYKVAGDKAFNWHKEFPQVFGAKIDIDIEMVDAIPYEPDYLALLQTDAKEAAEAANQAIAMSKEAIAISEKAAALSLKVIEYAQKLQSVSEPLPFYGINKGGFDVVIGNPPYFNIQTLGVSSKEAQWIQKNYSEIWQDKSDILFFFFYKAMQISKSEIGFIISNAFLFSDKAQKLRNYIIDDNRLSKIINFEKFMVFSDASITSCITIFNRNKSETNAIVLKEKNYNITEVAEKINNIDLEFCVKLKKNIVFALVDDKTGNINKKIDKNHKELQEVCYLGKGMETAANSVFSFDIYPSQFPSEFIKKRMVGENINRYYLNTSNNYILYFENIDNYEDLPISIQEHLLVNKSILENRATVKNEGRVWWRYSRPMHKDYYHLNKIWCSYRGIENRFILDESSNYIGLTNTTVIFDTNINFSLKYILTLLNSKLLNFRYKSIGKQTGSGVFEYFANGIGKLPIPLCENQQPFIEKADQILILTNNLQETSQKFQRSLQRKFELKQLPKKLQDWYLLSYSDLIKELAKKNVKLSLRDEAEWEDYFNQERAKALELNGIIYTTDKAIDKMVYELYGLNDEEISFVEES